MTSSELQLLLLKKKTLVLKKKTLLAKKIKRKYWVHPINLKRNKFGLCSTLLPELREQNAESRHKSYFRMSVEKFDYLLRLVAPILTQQDTNMRQAIEPTLKLAITLHHLAEGNSHKSIANHYRLGRSTVSNIIYATCDALYEALQPTYLAVPKGKEEWKKIAEGFVFTRTMLLCYN
ncbi:hypothetical protein EB796_007607 [Bugula neritina]|uniref:Uncharacterized protein n=1 Tax=Bugula neritina TaxID=10212 RepID=A0A7J7K640_BUGNE|nr:hypothetical protein EB796_007607 [Bugula neritina]